MYDISFEDHNNLQVAAFKMQKAYEEESNSQDAVLRVKKEFPDNDGLCITLWQLEGMWLAIDAYADNNT